MSAQGANDDEVLLAGVVSSILLGVVGEYTQHPPVGVAAEAGLAPTIMSVLAARTVPDSPASARLEKIITPVPPRELQAVASPTTVVL
ncbi:hypothetical protein, partial [Nocardioides sp.]|uniref:hypothetical protein n=1 Tax=Nocardioides sp. TaxID=35761 RepID=UPI003563FD18